MTSACSSLNEAFAVQVLSFLDAFGIADDDRRVNPYGGAIAVGHPLASSGVRLMIQARAPVRRATRRPVRPHGDVRRSRPGRRRDLGEPELRRERTMSTAPRPERVAHARVQDVTLPAAWARSPWSRSTTGWTTPSRPRSVPPGWRSLTEAFQALQARVRRGEPRRRRGDRQAVGLRGGRRPHAGDGRPDPRPGAGPGSQRPRGVPPAALDGRADVRVRQRRRAGWWPRAWR